MKKIIILALLLLSICTANAQDSFNFCIGTNVGVPMGSFSDIAKVGIGGDMAIDFLIAENLAATIYLDYVKFNGKEITFKNGAYKSDVHSVNFLAGLKYYFTNNFYSSFKFGLRSIVSVDESRPGLNLLPQGPIPTLLGIRGDIAASLGAGYKYGVLDISGHYMHAEYTNHLLFRVGLSL